MIDKAEFRDNFNHYDKRVILRIIDIFINEYPDRFVVLQKNINELNFVSVHHNAHSFKGIVTYMSPDLTDLARRLENMGKEKDGNGLQELYDELKDGTLILVNELIDLRKEYES
jgi:HPt (histidine-containing phosphotransfer) domain-containing protein